MALNTLRLYDVLLYAERGRISQASLLPLGRGDGERCRESNEHDRRKGEACRVGAKQGKNEREGSAKKQTNEQTQRVDRETKETQQIEREKAGHTGA